MESFTWKITVNKSVQYFSHSLADIYGMAMAATFVCELTRKYYCAQKCAILSLSLHLCLSLSGRWKGNAMHPCIQLVVLWPTVAPVMIKRKWAGPFLSLLSSPTRSLLSHPPPLTFSSPTLIKAEHEFIDRHACMLRWLQAFYSIPCMV